MWTGRTDVLQGSGEAGYHVSKITLRFVERGISGKGNRYYSGRFRAKLTRACSCPTLADSKLV